MESTNEQVGYKDSTFLAVMARPMVIKPCMHLQPISGNQRMHCVTPERIHFGGRADNYNTINSS